MTTPRYSVASLRQLAIDLFTAAGMETAQPLKPPPESVAEAKS